MLTCWGEGARRIKKKSERRLTPCSVAFRVTASPALFRRGFLDGKYAALPHRHRGTKGRPLC